MDSTQLDSFAFNDPMLKQQGGLLLGILPLVAQLLLPAAHTQRSNTNMTSISCGTTNLWKFVYVSPVDYGHYGNHTVGNASVDSEIQFK